MHFTWGVTLMAHHGACPSQVRCSTGEGWNGIMYDVASTSDCSDTPEWDDPVASGCGTPVSYLFFYSFTLLVTFVMLNVFIAVILGEIVRVCRLSRDARW